MAEPVSIKLVTASNGQQFLVTGNPNVGYRLERIRQVELIGNYVRSWQAVSDAHHHAADEEARRG